MLASLTMEEDEKVAIAAGCRRNKDDLVVAMLRKRLIGVEPYTIVRPFLLSQR